jgi:hypothetical protein
LDVFMDVGVGCPTDSDVFTVITGLSGDWGVVRVRGQDLRD